MAGIQSVNDIRTGTVSYGASGGGCAWEEMVDASIKRKNEAANYPSDNIGLIERGMSKPRARATGERRIGLPVHLRGRSRYLGLFRPSLV
jgi:hypothetical protein